MIKNIIFDVGEVLLGYRWKAMLMDYGLDENEAVRLMMICGHSLICSQNQLIV